MAFLSYKKGIFLCKAIPFHFPALHVLQETVQNALHMVLVGPHISMARCPLKHVLELCSEEPSGSRISLHLHWACTYTDGLHTSEERAKPPRQLSIFARFSIHLNVYKSYEKQNKNKKKSHQNSDIATFRVNHSVLKQEQFLLALDIFPRRKTRP